MDIQITPVVIANLLIHDLNRICRNCRTGGRKPAEPAAHFVSVAIPDEVFTLLDVRACDVFLRPYAESLWNKMCQKGSMWDSEFVVEDSIPMPGEKLSGCYTACTDVESGLSIVVGDWIGRQGLLQAGIAFSIKPLPARAVRRERSIEILQDRDLVEVA